ncbi:MAG: hypothetical protein LBS74_05885 [Oscillospiraceae bacterium]|nr:hypothetical protein [Oscillospiraceae bacterium]
MKRLLVILMCVSFLFAMPSCKKKDNLEVESYVDPAEILDTMTPENLVNNSAFTSGNDSDGSLEAYVFMSDEDKTLYYFGKTNKVGNWSVKGDQLSIHYTSDDTGAIDESKTYTIAILAETGITLDTQELIYFGTAQDYLNQDSTTDT